MSTERSREAPKEGRTYGWILGNQYQERGYHDEGDKGDRGEPWYLTVDGTPWSAFDVRFFPDHEFHGVPHRNDPNLMLCDFVFHNRRCDLTKQRHDELFASAALLGPPSLQSPTISHCALCEDPNFIYRDCLLAAQQRGAELQREVDAKLVRSHKYYDKGEGLEDDDPHSDEHPDYIRAAIDEALEEAADSIRAAKQQRSSQQ